MDTDIKVILVLVLSSLGSHISKKYPLSLNICHRYISYERDMIVERDSIYMMFLGGYEAFGQA